MKDVNNIPALHEADKVPKQNKMYRFQIM